MTDALQRLKDKQATISDLNAAAALLSWDQQTYMPEGAIASRAEQMATLRKLTHEMFVSDEMGALIDELEGRYDPESDEGAIVRISRRDYDYATKLPSELVAREVRAFTMADPAWAKARETNDWSLFAPHLEGLVEIAREVANHYDSSAHPFDALMQIGEPGLTKDQITAMYEELKRHTVPMIAAMSEQRDPERSAPLYGAFDEAKQEAFGIDVVRRYGFDWQRGRQDRAVHPFCTNFGATDVRLTTRFDPEWLSPALFGTLHESGHGMYEQGIAPRLARTIVAGGCSMGVHESQSRLWENLVGRSRPFWEFFYPKLQEAFPERLGSVDLERFYRAINVVEPSMIRVEADEVTYNMHTLLRFELEVGLLEGSLKVADLPEAWNAKMQEYLGITPANDSEGVLQDVHWSAGLFAYFPTYTIGNVLSVQFFDAAVKAQPSIISDMERGEFDKLHGWLKENVYQYGRIYDPNDLVTRATGRPMDTAPYIAYLKEKFGALYEL